MEKRATTCVRNLAKTIYVIKIRAIVSSARRSVLLVLRVINAYQVLGEIFALNAVHPIV